MRTMGSGLPINTMSSGLPMDTISSELPMNTIRSEILMNTISSELPMNRDQGYQSAAIELRLILASQSSTIPRIKDGNRFPKQ